MQGGLTIQGMTAIDRLSLGAEGTVLVHARSGFDEVLLRYDRYGALIPSFGTDGVFQLPHVSGMRSDGRMVTAMPAYGSEAAAHDLGFQQQTLDWSWSPLIGVDSFYSDNPRSIAVLASGKVAVVTESGRVWRPAEGGSYSYDYKWSVFRFNVDGSLDTSFGSAGVVSTQFAATDTGTAALPYQILEQADGRLLVGGMSSEGEISATVTRYTVDGQLDTTFGGGDGIVSVKPSPTYSPGLVDMILQPDGKIVAVGAVQQGYNELDFALFRLNSDGSLDATFGAHGIKWVTLTEHSDNPLALQRQADGKILVLVGIEDTTSFTGGPAAQGPLGLRVLRFTTAGELDASFGVAGQVDVPLGSYVVTAGFAGTYVGDLLVLPDNSFIVGGNAAGTSSNTGALAHYSANGAPIASFGASNGVRTPDEAILTPLTGTDRDDILRPFFASAEGGAGNDWIHGRDPLLADTAVFGDVRSNFQITTGDLPPGVAGNSYRTVVHTPGNLGTDRLVDIDRIVFTDGGLAFDLNAAAGRVARILGAVFGPDAVTQRPDYVGIGLHLADNPQHTAVSLAEMALTARLGAGATHQAVVTLLYQNVIGTAPDAATLASYTQLLASGAESQASLAVLAAESIFNAARINLTGLAENGLTFT